MTCMLQASRVAAELSATMIPLSNEETFHLAPEMIARSNDEGLKRSSATTHQSKPISSEPRPQLGGRHAQNPAYGIERLRGARGRRSALHKVPMRNDGHRRGCRMQ